MIGMKANEDLNKKTKKMIYKSPDFKWLDFITYSAIYPRERFVLPVLLVYDPEQSLFWIFQFWLVWWVVKFSDQQVGEFGFINVTGVADVGEFEDRDVFDIH